MNEEQKILLQEKNLALCVIFTMISFGLYCPFWQYGICKRIRVLAGESGGAGGELALILLVPFYGYYWMYTRSQKLANSATSCGIPLTDNGVINLLLCILGFGIVALILLQADLNKVALAYQQAKW